MNFDEFAFMAGANAKSWSDDYYDMCANEEFGGIESFLNAADPLNHNPSQETTPTHTATINSSTPTIPISSITNRSSNLDDNKATSTAIVSSTNIMQAGTDTANSVPVSRHLK